MNRLPASGSVTVTGPASRSNTAAEYSVSRCGEAYQVVGSDPACRLLGNRRFAGYRLVDQQFDDRRWCRQPDDYHVGECECENYANTKILWR
jgi:hypothetical protein